MMIPKLISKILCGFCPPHLLEEIEGDLIQKFNRDIKIVGEKKAKRRLIWNTVRFFRPGVLLRNRFSMELNQLHMIKSYFTVMFRNILKRKFYSAINILCLTLGITFALLIGMFVYSELQVNQSLKDIDQLYLIQSKTKTNNDPDFFAASILPKQCIAQYPDLFESYYRFRDRNITVSKEDKHLRIQGMIGDSSFISIFGFTVVAGNGATALKNLNSIVVTEKTANQFFNKTNVVGETLTVSTEQNGRQEYTITAVIKEPDDKNSVTDFMNMDAQIFLSLENSRDFFPQFDQNSWNDFIISYIKLSPKAKAKDAEAAINKMFQRDAPKANSDSRTYLLSPISDYYLLTNHAAVRKLILSLVVIVFFILVLAISNFINISIASSFSRSKEVGVRKVIGGLRKHVITQFLLESMVLSFFSGILGIFMYQLSHRYFSELLGASLPSILYFDKAFWLIVVASVFLIGLLAGIYPALFQSLAKPIDSLKGKFKSVQGSIQFSRVLIGTQFLITIFIFIGAVVLSSQASYFIDKDLGYNKSHVLIVSSVPRLWNETGFQKMESAKKEFLQSSKIQSLTLSWGAPGWGFSPGGGKVNKAGSPVDKGEDFIITCADEDFKIVFDLKLLDGKFLDDAGTRQPNGVMINEAAQKALGIQLGDQLKAEGYGDILFTVKGIIQDFNYESLHQRINPLMLIHTKDFNAYRCFSFRLEAGSPGESVKEVEQLWKRIFPDDDFNYSFADDRLQALYTTELQMKKAATVATILMLVIVVTGVLGLVSLSVSKRTKEIGVRKVLGATISNILALLAKEYVVLMVVSFLVAVPLAYFLANKWLENFAYHIALSWWMFVVPIAILFCIILCIVGSQSFKTANTNPVNALKCE